MKKISAFERSVLLLTALFLLLSALWFFFENRQRELTRITVSTPEAAQAAIEPAERSPAPGILAGERINVNTASWEDLTRLPGIGEAKARNIVAHREAQGPFAAPGDLIQVPGIGEKTLEKLLDYVTVEEEGGAWDVKNSGGG